MNKIKYRKGLFITIFIAFLCFLSITLTNKLYNNNPYVKYTISIFDSNYLPELVKITDKDIPYLNAIIDQVFDNCKKNNYSSELLNFSYRKVDQVLFIEFMFKEDADDLLLDAKLCINKSYDYYHKIIQKYFIDIVNNRLINSKFIDMISEYLEIMEIDPKHLKNKMNIVGKHYQMLEMSKNFKEPKVDDILIADYDLPNYIYTEKNFIYKEKINKLSLFLIIILNLSSFCLLIYFFFKRK